MSNPLSFAQLLVWSGPSRFSSSVGASCPAFSDASGPYASTVSDSRLSSTPTDKKGRAAWSRGERRMSTLKRYATPLISIQVPQDQYPFLCVKVHALRLINHHHQRSDVIGRRAEHVLVCPIIENELQRKLAGLASFPFVVIAVNLGDLPDVDGLLGTLFRLCHREYTSSSVVSWRVKRDNGYSRTRLETPQTGTAIPEGPKPQLSGTPVNNLTAHEAIAAHNPAQILSLPTAGIAAEGASPIIGPRALPRISEVALRRSRSQGIFGEPGH